ncbi:MAG: TIGR00725 family protein [Blastocatellia bacterium]|nr:TIGR00725 family protein [Blastocatellia bacterium]MCS7156985.1 TIGR00725 family protein [Blastocatellia bacterium]MCX7752186.1 TIGR00725 family protein [Blastocatellia bacterium]MDW8167678.1 TIGR00725 family protein [Acidobacteriota bacterium]MDW8256277.1 TIGR00725 family protein [Acidobacteriota bacterium]
MTMAFARRPIIGVMGSSQCDPTIYEQARAVGRLIAERGAVLLCGGLGGVMEAAARGAFEAGGLTVGILPGGSERESPPNPYIHIAIFTGLSEARNVINVRSAEAIIAIAGGYGTLSEIALALKVGKPVVLLHSWRFESPFGDDEGFVRTAETPEEAVALAFESLAQGRGR